MKRLCDDALSADAARILRSAESDAPSSPDAQQARIIEAYGVMRPALLSSGSAFDSLRRRKWAAIVGTFVIASAIVIAWPHGPAEKTPLASTRTASTTIPMVPLTPQASEPSVRVEDLPAAPTVAAIAAPPRPVTAAAAPDELAVIDAARAALRTGRPEETLTRIVAWRAAFPHPLYAEEADALEVRALSTMGRLDEARAKAGVFFRAHPDSPYEQQIRGAIGETQR